MLGLFIDWKLEISTCDKEYKYHKNYLSIYNKGLVSEKKHMLIGIL